jgi:hypothetical protein
MRLIGNTSRVLRDLPKDAVTAVTIWMNERNYGNRGLTAAVGRRGLQKIPHPFREEMKWMGIVIKPVNDLLGCFNADPSFAQSPNGDLCRSTTGETCPNSVAFRR